MVGVAGVMKPYFISNPGATILFVGTCAVWGLVEIRQLLRRRPGATVGNRGSHLVIALTVGAAIILAALARTKVPSTAFPSGATSFGIGLAIMWAGIALRWWSISTLGRFFTADVMTSPDQPVITSGPYSVVRHPSYTGMLLVLCGLGVMFANWLSIAALIVLPLIGLGYRIYVEEAALSASLGEAYRSYAASHKRLIPFVW